MIVRLGTITLAALMFVPSNVDILRHNWLAVPGHPNVLVDLASIRPEPRMIERGNGNPRGVPSPYDTYVELRLNGEPAFTFLACYPPPCVSVSSDDGPYLNNNRLVGYVPEKAIMKLVCKLVAPPHDEWVCKR